MNRQMTTDSTVTSRETVENLGGTITEYTYFEPTEEKPGRGRIAPLFDVQPSWKS